MANFPKINEVLDNDMLRETIVNHAICEGDSVSISSVCSLRRVSSAWLQSVSKVLRKKGYPLFRIDLSTTNEQLDCFLAATSASFRIHSPIPPFALTVKEDFFHQTKIHNSLSHCFLQNEGGLVDLKVVVRKEGKIFIPSLTESYSLPLLKRLEVRFEENQNYPAGNSNMEEVNIDTENLLNLTNSVLIAARSLTILSFTSKLPNFLNSFQFQLLPSTLTQLEIHCPIKNGELQGLLGSTLPNLAVLVLTVPENESLPDGLLFHVLDSFKKTLGTLRIKGVEYKTSSKQVSFLRLPVMSALKTLEMSSINVELEPGQSSLERFLPKLQHLHISEQSYKMFRKWTVNSEYLHVEEVKVCLVDEDFSQDGPNEYLVNPDAEVLHLIKKSFPNMRKLTVDVSAEDTRRLTFLFEMKQLTSLSIRLVESPADLDSDMVDSMLLGMPLDMVEMLGNTPEYWDQIELLSGLNKLQELTQLTLEFSKDYENQRRRPINLNLTFTLALMRMPSLKHVDLSKGFSISKTVKEKWEEMGIRTLSTHLVDND